MTYAVDASPDSPILIDRYIIGKEVEVDCIGDGTDVLIPGIMEHIERAGVHSGDSMSVYPPGDAVTAGEGYRHRLRRAHLRARCTWSG